MRAAAPPPPAAAVARQTVGLGLVLTRNRRGDTEVEEVIPGFAAYHSGEVRARLAPSRLLRAPLSEASFLGGILSRRHPGWPAPLRSPPQPPLLPPSLCVPSHAPVPKARAYATHFPQGTRTGALTWAGARDR